ncbi:hypothetical protein GC176_27635 [bacterium]|nr:hypothetical protein [bacterium]
MSPEKLRAKFPLGRLLITPGASSRLTTNDVLTALARHFDGDWGDICETDRVLNNAALVDGGQLLSVYHSRNGTAFQVISEGDRSVTTILLPEEY